MATPTSKDKYKEVHWSLSRSSLTVSSVGVFSFSLSNCQRYHHYALHNTVGSIAHLDDEIRVLAVPQLTCMSDSHTIESREFKAEALKQVFCML